MAQDPLEAVSRLANSSGQTLAAPEGLWLASELLRSPALSVSSALISIATALVGCCDTVGVLDTLDGAAVGIFGAESMPLEVQAHRLGQVLTNTLALIPDSTDHRGLLVDQALDLRHAHPVLIAAIGHELAQRAGLGSHMCVSAQGWWTALVDEDRMVLVGSGNDDPPSSISSIRYVCPHQLAGVVLGELARHRTQPWSDRAAELERSLPPCHPHGQRA